MASSHNDGGKAIGIDLGTTYSCVGIWRGDHDRVDIIANDQGNRTTPSMVAFTDNERLIGQPAKNQVASNPANTVFDAKRLIGRRFSDESVRKDKCLWPFSIVCGPNDKPLIQVTFKGENKTFMAEEISSMVLLKMKEIAETYLGCQVNKAVITVPAYYTNSQRQTTKDAGKIAGFDVLQILNEPTAAAIAYGFDRKAYSSDDGENILIFDLGGGTFDVAVLNIKKHKIEVKAVGGDTHLGGEDFDNRMVSHFVQEFQKKYKIDISSNAKALRRLRSECERAKRELSSSVEAIVEVPCLHGTQDLHSKIRRAKFEQMNMDLFEKCIEIVGKCLEDSRMSKTQIDNIVLVGGSTRIPKVQELLKDFFDGRKELSKSIHPDEAVAYGASVQAAVLNGDHTANLILRDVTPLSLGIRKFRDSMSVLIPRNTQIPVRRERSYCTVADNQDSVLIDAYEGERPNIKHNNLLGEFLLEGLPCAPRGEIKIIVGMEIDANGIVKMSAEQKTSGIKEAMIMTNESGRLSDDDIAKMIAEAEKLKIEDQLWKKTVELRNALDQYIYDMNKRLNNEKVREGIEEKDAEDMKAGLEKAGKWLSENANADKDDLIKKMKKVKRLCRKMDKDQKELPT